MTNDLPVSHPEFGPFLRALRRRAGMTQRDLAAAVGFSEAQISRLEKRQRLPDVTMVAEIFVPALGLGDDPRLAVQLVELAAAARGERPPTALAVQRTVRTVVAADEGAAGGNLPAPPTDLLGREREIDQLVNRMLGHTGRLITLLGPPGIGKTRLALAAAWRLAMIYADGAYFIPLASIDDPELVATTITGELTIPDQARKPLQARLIEYLRRKELLLVLDNFEQLLDAAPLVADLLAACPQLRVIVTSRERLHLRAEQRFQVHTLDDGAAAALFCARAGAVSPDFTPTPATLATVGQICTLLDRLPLAIELSAARIDLLSPAQLLASLQERALDVLSGGPRDLPAHQRTLRAAVRRSYDLLTAREQALMRRIAVFIGGFATDAVKAMGFELATLQSLVGKSLVQSSTARDGTTRFSQLDTLRLFGLEELARAGEEAAARAAQAAFCQQLVIPSAMAPVGADKKRLLDRLEDEVYNLRAALRNLLETDADAAQHLAGTLREFWYVRGHITEGRDWVAQALALSDAPTPARAAALLAAGQLAMAQSDYADAHQLTAAAYTIFAAQYDAAGMAQARHIAGWLARETESLASAYDAFRQSLALARALDDRPLIVQNLTSLAAVLGASGGDRTELNSYLDECLEILRDLGDDEGLALVLARKGTQEMVAGNFADAAAMLAEAATLFQALAYKREEAWAREELGEAHLLLHNLGAARTQLDAAQELFTRVGEQLGLMLLEHHYGQLARREGRFAQADVHYARSLRHFATTKNQKMIARCLAGLGATALRQQQRSRAASLLTVAQAQLTALPPFLPPVEYAEYSRLATAAHAALADYVEPPAPLALPALTLADAVTLALSGIPQR